MSNIGKLGAVLVLLAVGSLAAGASFSGATHVFTVTGESVTVDYDTDTTVSAADVAVSFYDNETIYNTTGNLAEGDDYEWNTENGTIDWNNTSQTTDGEVVSIDYAYDAPSQRSRDLSGVLQLMGYGLGVTLLFAGGLVVLGWLSNTGGR